MNPPIQNSNTPASLSETFLRLQELNQGAFMPFMTAGFPDLDQCYRLLSAMARGGADIIELGVPFSDPLADGPTIQKTSHMALQQGTHLEDALNLVIRLRQDGLLTPVVLMGYCNPFLAYGIEAFAKKAAECGVQGVIVPDLPPEEALSWQEVFRPYGIDMIFFISPTTSDQRIEDIQKVASGFIYGISVTGVTGARQALDPRLPDFCKKIKNKLSLPLAIGFGISTEEQIHHVCSHANGAIMASALLDLLLKTPTSEQEMILLEKIKACKQATLR